MAMVRLEDDDGVLAQSKFIKVGKQVADTRILTGDESVVEPAGMRQLGVGLQPVSFTLVGVVRCIHGKIHEKGAGLVLFNEVTGFTHHQVGEKLPILEDFFSIAVQVMAVGTLPVEEV